MIKIKFDSKMFNREMNNIINYSIGFLDGAQAGKIQFMRALGEETALLLGEFIDANARVSPATLQHVYEWYQTGSPEARLFDIVYVSNSKSINFKTNFKQSTTIQSGSNTPFYNKASIMESGQTVVIKPRNSDVLSFDIDGEQVFTKTPVVVENPGGQQAQRGFENVCNIFFSRYFTQSFLKTSKVAMHLNNPVEFKRSLQAGKRNGRGAGLKAGYNWMTKVGVA
jgi:hypothetical protein